MAVLFGFGGPLLDLFARFIVWMYMPAIMCFLIAFHFLRDSLAVFLVRQDLPLSGRFGFALKAIFGAVQAVVAGVVIFLCIYYRVEIFKCVSHLF